MSNRFRPAAELLVKARQVKVRIGKRCISIYSRTVGSEGLVPASQFLHCGAQVDAGCGIGAPAPDRQSVMLDSLARAAGQLEQPAEIDMSIHERGVAGQSLGVGMKGAGWVSHLELQPTIEPLPGLCSRIAGALTAR